MGTSTDPYYAGPVIIGQVDVSKLTEGMLDAKTLSVGILPAKDLEVKSTEPEDDSFGNEESSVPEGSINEILTWVGNDPENALNALNAEKAGQNRKTLIKKLEEILD